MSEDSFFHFGTIHGVDGEHETSYMTRLWIGRLRLHIFHRGDADPDPHDHPWDFWTFPLTAYVEQVVNVEISRRLHNAGWAEGFDEKGAQFLQWVPAFRWSYRPAEHSHRVLGRYLGHGVNGVVTRPQPGVVRQPVHGPGRIVTIVWRSRKARRWGFLKQRDGRWCWVHWREYSFGGGKNAPCGPAGERLK